MRGLESHILVEVLIEGRLMTELPTGTVTFLFTDMEGSTELVQRLGDTLYAKVLQTHHALLRGAFAAHHGREIDTQGEAFFAVFENAPDAVRAALAIQAAVAKQRWPQQADIHLRIGIHTGTPQLVAGAYVGVDVHRAARICAAGHGGQVLLSQTTRALVEDILLPGVHLQDLGEHRLRDLRQPERIFHLLHPHSPSAPAPLRSLSILPHNLPVQLTSFVGRDREMGEVRHLLGRTRLLTLTGPGGSGKTRLALQVAADLLDDYPDGIWLVELARLSDATLVVSAMASVLKVREETGRSLEVTLRDALRGKRLLLILDNCEHVVAACAHTAESLLHVAPHVKIVATSRERLAVVGETSYQVPPLALPEIHGEPAIDHLIKTESVRLFLERASSVQPGFALTPADAAHVARIVQTLDGIPLAIELAAARVNVLSVPQIAERLQDRFHLLTVGGRTAAPRHQTLRATMDWSYDLLGESERLLLRRLSVFGGGFTLEAAESVCADERVALVEVLDLLARLVDKSLVMVDQPDGDRRYRLLDTVRQYGRERLLDSGEAARIQDQHLQFSVAFAEQAEIHVRGRGQQQWLDRLETEHDNLRAALEWAKGKLAPDESELRLAAALWLFWDLHGHWREGRSRLHDALERRPAASPTARARALYAAGRLARRQGDNALAAELLTASLQLCRETSDQFGVACSLLDLGVIARREGRLQEAADRHTESLAIFRQLDDDWGMAWSVRLLGIVKFLQGTVDEANEHFQESLVISTSRGDLQGIAASLHGLGRVATHRGQYFDAFSFLKEGLGYFHELGDQEGVAASLHVLGRVATGRHAHRHALVLFAAAAMRRETIGAPLPESDQVEYDRCLAEAKHHLGTDDFAALWTQGQGMTAPQAVAYAMTNPDEVSDR